MLHQLCLSVVSGRQMVVWWLEVRIPSYPFREHDPFPPYIRHINRSPVVKYGWLAINFNYEAILFPYFTDCAMIPRISVRLAVVTFVVLVFVPLIV